MAAPPAIETHALTKTFERKPERGLAALFKRGAKGPPLTAVDHVDLRVERGELFGLLGPNGAGKTTLVKLLCTLLMPTSGEARVAGHDVAREPDAVRRKVGVVLGGERALYWRLTARENLWYFSQLYDVEPALARRRIDDLLQRVGLTDRADERVENYSKGMKQRLHIARGLLNDPEVLLLDEPTIGLDPHAARALRELVRDLVAGGERTIVLTTHYLYEADALSDRVAILNKGKVIALDAPGALKRRFAPEDVTRLEVRGAPADLAARLARAGGVARVVPAGADASRGTESYRVFATKTDEGIAGALAAAAEAAGARVIAVAREEPTLEDVFVELTGERMTPGEVPRG